MKILAASDPIGTLIFVVIVIVFSAISSYLKKKRGATGGEQDPEAPFPTPPPLSRRREGRTAPESQTRAASWEEEIKRLLEGQAPVEPPAPPPIVVVEPTRPPPVTPPPIVTRRVPVEETESHELHERVHMAGMREAEAAHARVAQLHELVEQRLHSAGQHAHVPLPPAAIIGRRERSGEVTAALALLRRPQSARQAIILHAVLGPPKGLEA